VVSEPVISSKRPQLRSAASQRVQTERDFVVNKEAPVRAAAAPKSVKIDVPRAIRATPSPRTETPRSVTPAPHQSLRGLSPSSR